MKITIKPPANNTKNILTLLEEAGYTLPCNCHGARLCNGRQYSFDCSMVPQNTVTVSLEKETESIEGLSLTPDSPSSLMTDAVLVDIGTTTIALSLINTEHKKILASSSFANPQRSFGKDVISRIQSSLQGNSDSLKQCLCQSLKQELSTLCQKSGQAVHNIKSAYLGGNTTMIHLLLGYDVSSLSRSPFTVRETSPEPFCYGSCRVTILPWISAFIGGDITAGILACRLEQHDSALFLDLGTNGEMVLKVRDHYYACSTAAGPAFEGNGLSCGCAAVAGAVSSVSVKPLGCLCQTIDNKLPVGICGSGALSLCSDLIRKHYVTADGILTRRFPEKGIFLSRKADGSSLYFTADDFRTIQLAKAAIGAGIDILLSEAGLTAPELDHIFLGGGFGFYVSVKDCETLGLLPSRTRHSVQALGNTCLTGLFNYATKNCSLPDISHIQTISLANHPDFQSKYLEHMKFPVLSD